MLRHLTRRSRVRGGRAWLAVACLAATACTAAREPLPLRVMSYNIAAGAGDIGRIAAVIRAAAPDIVALQEVDVHWGERSGFEDQAGALGDMLGMHVGFGPIYTLPGVSAEAAPRQFGLAVLSRGPILDFRNHNIPRLSTQSDEPEPQLLPGFLEAIVDVRGARIHVFNTHLDYRADPRVRVQQVAAMLDLLGERTAPLILMGDLNASPDTPELRPLLTRLQDAWSGSQDAGHTYPASAPRRRIDYVLLSGHFTVTAARIVPGVASDHLPVVVDVLVH
jgi:endonuclease/exonuclease/phosphatase family metal-dependent hydrolase